MGGMLLCFSALLLTGCGKSSATLSGSVSYGGQPIANGSIALQAQDEDGTSTSVAIQNGNYSFGEDSGLTTGKYQVRVYAFADKAVNQANTEDAALDPDDGEAVEGPPTSGGGENIIPSAYNAASKLTYEVASGENSKDFNLDKVNEDL
ncbi:MAG: carboxypeptidase-like regulatory domain-containing protein [Pirellulaceae bacterium]|nr:carboxypeptidase-like regulatory domain-containing protein [Pirellulaceae bacterium]